MIENYYFIDLWEMLLFVRKNILQNNYQIKYEEYSYTSIIRIILTSGIKNEKYFKSYHIDKLSFELQLSNYFQNDCDDNKIKIFDYIKKNKKDFNWLSDIESSFGKILDRYNQLDIFS